MNKLISIDEQERQVYLEEIVRFFAERSGFRGAIRVESDGTGGTYITWDA